jgi:GDP-D-mannose 3', 5'-epimerase
MKKALVCGAGGFIGGHLVKYLKAKGYWVRGVDLKYNEWQPVHEFADDFVQADLRIPQMVQKVVTDDIDEIYQLAADMGGAGFVFTGENDADIMHNSALCNLNIAHEAAEKGVKRVFYSSSACMYPEHNQLDPENPNCTEDSAYPANPDSDYGWEKLFSERLFMAFARNKDLEVRVARFHNIFGEYGSWTGGREKAPAAFCRKAAETPDDGTIEVWGPGSQTRSFLHVSECCEAVYRFMQSDFAGPVNIGSEEMISINDFAQMAIDISGKNLSIHNIDGEEFEEKYGHKCPIGVNGRNSDNNLYRKKVGWEVSQPLIEGMRQTYKWISGQVKKTT